MVHAMSANSEPPKRVLSSRVGISLPKHQLLCRFSPAWGYCHCCSAGRGLVVCRFVYSSSAEGPEKRYRLSRHRSAILTRNGRGGGASYRRATHTPAGRTPDMLGHSERAEPIMSYLNETTGLR